MATPLLSTPRPPYLHFILLNILILLIGAEAGLVSFFLQFHPDQSNGLDHVKQKKKGVKKSTSMPSIFFIGEGHTSRGVEEESLLLGDEEVMSGEELCEKAEKLIGNFYKQLRMQREESWNKLCHLYYKTPFSS